MTLARRTVGLDAYGISRCGSCQRLAQPEVDHHDVGGVYHCTRTDYTDDNWMCRWQAVWIATSTSISSSIRELCFVDRESRFVVRWIIRIWEWHSWCRWTKRDFGMKLRRIKTAWCGARREAVEVPVSWSRWPVAREGNTCTSEYHAISFTNSQHYKNSENNCHKKVLYLTKKT